jgi:hypothetical protein
MNCRESQISERWRSEYNPDFRIHQRGTKSARNQLQRFEN